MRNLLLIITMGMLFNGCSLFSMGENTENIGKKNCKLTCLNLNKSYQGYDKDLGCFCGIK